MTDRHSAYIVVLDHDIREDDAEPILGALRMVKGVLRVEPVAASFEEHIAQSRADSAWREKLLALLQA